MRPEDHPVDTDIARRLHELERENARLRAHLATLAPSSMPADTIGRTVTDRSPRVDRRRWAIAWGARLVLFGLGLAVGAAVFRSERADFVRGFRDGFSTGAAARQQVRELTRPQTAPQR